MREGTQASFSLVNTSDAPIKFRWPPHPSITFVPATGHIGPGGRKDVIVRYKSAAAEKLVDVPITFSSQRIRYAADASLPPEGEGRVI